MYFSTLTLLLFGCVGTTVGPISAASISSATRDSTYGQGPLLKLKPFSPRTTPGSSAPSLLFDMCLNVNSTVSAHQLRTRYIFNVINRSIMKNGHLKSCGKHQRRRMCQRRSIRRLSCSSRSGGIGVAGAETFQSRAIRRNGNSTCIDVIFKPEQKRGNVCFAEFWFTDNTALSLNEASLAGEGHLFVLDPDSNVLAKIRPRHRARTRRHPWMVVDLTDMVSSWTESEKVLRNISVCWSKTASELLRLSGREGWQEVQGQFDRLHGNCSEPAELDRSPFLVVGRLSSENVKIIPRNLSPSQELPGNVSVGLQTTKNNPLSLPQPPRPIGETLPLLRFLRQRRDANVRRVHRRRSDGELVMPKNLHVARCENSCTPVSKIETLLFRTGRDYEIFTAPVMSSCSC